VDQQATRRPPIQSGATINPRCLKGSQGVTPFLKVTVIAYQIAVYCSWQRGPRRTLFSKP
jgi:hypothetical protein